MAHLYSGIFPVCYLPKGIQLQWANHVSLLHKKSLEAQKTSKILFQHRLSGTRYCSAEYFKLQEGVTLVQPLYPLVY